MINKDKPKFSIGYNWDYEGFSLLLEEYKNTIESVYFPIPIKYENTGRIFKGSEDYEKQVFQLIKKCKKLDISVILLVNSPKVKKEKFSRIIKYVNILNDLDMIDFVTIADMNLIKALRKKIKNIKIDVSIIAEINNEVQALKVKDLGADIITIDNDIVRDINIIKKIKKISDVKILLNNACIKGCKNKKEHYHFLSKAHNIDLNKNNEKKFKEYNRKCLIPLMKEPWRIFSCCFIRPEDIKYYLGKGYFFKLSTRDVKTERIKNILDAYIKQKYDGNLVDLLTSTSIRCLFDSIDNKKLEKYNFFEKLSNCDEKCRSCKYCKDLLRETAIFNKKNKCLKCDVFGIGKFLKDKI